jgi:hypothetical protein
VSNNARRSIRSLSPSPTPPLPTQEEQDLEDLQEEIEAYPALIEAGGRAPYPVHLLKDIFDHPQRYLANPHYRDIMTFWRSHIICEEERTLLCSGLLSRWGAFRKVQRIIRERNVMSEWTLIHAADWDTWETFIERFGPKEGEWGFSKYAERMKKRLAKYGFSRPFQLKSDLLRQDTLTTWIEYLGYEYRFYDQYASYVKRFQRVHDKAWKNLVDSGVLSAGETIEVICDIERVFKDATQEERAEQTVQCAIAAYLLAEKHCRDSSANKERGLADQSRLCLAQNAVEEAKATYQQLKRRGDAITDFCQEVKGYRNAYDNAENHACLLRWIQQQIPLIEHESISVESAGASAGCVVKVQSLDVAVPEHVEQSQHLGTRCPAVGGSATPHLEETLPTLVGTGHGKRKRSNCEADNPRRYKRSKFTDQGHFSGALATVTSDTVPAALGVPESITESGSGGQELENTTASWSLSSQLRRPLRRSARIADQRAPLIRSRPKTIVKGAPEKYWKRIGLVSGSDHTTSRAARKSRKKADVHRPHTKRCLIPVE